MIRTYEISEYRARRVPAREIVDGDADPSLAHFLADVPASGLGETRIVRGVRAWLRRRKGGRELQPVTLELAAARAAWKLDGGYSSAWDVRRWLAEEAAFVSPGVSRNACEQLRVVVSVHPADVRGFRPWADIYVRWEIWR